VNYLDGFSGYGGFHLGLDKAGFHFDNVYFSEIDKHAIANYSYNFPNSIYVGSITDVSRGTIPSIDLFTFGWPCQDNSIAGKRRGQREGTRSGLLHQAVRVINEFKPRNFIAENVFGLLSVNEGYDIIESLELLSYLNESCPQYDIEMQLLNTRWVLPQNRERLFFVGHLRGSGSRQIFPIGEAQTICEQGRPASKELCIALPLLRRQYANWKGNYVVTSRGTRRLTPKECERLQGLPDNWTKNGIYNGQVKELSDTQRYKLCGNGVSSPIIELIGRKLKAA
jgi:DNA (cytosine-5)-methyltransferase 1